MNELQAIIFFVLAISFLVVLGAIAVIEIFGGDFDED